MLGGFKYKIDVYNIDTSEHTYLGGKDIFFKEMMMKMMLQLCYIRQEQQANPKKGYVD